MPRSETGMTTSFKDHFSGHAATSAAYRPTYPPRLFAWLASVVAQRRVAWDAGTGSGQAAIGLAGPFERGIATGASGAELAHAAAHPRVEYRVAAAESSGLAAASIDLVTVA